jgi:hypothetical protein
MNEKVSHGITYGNMESVSSAITMRNVLDHYKGKLFEVARNQAKENMTWRLMVNRLCIQSEGTVNTYVVFPVFTDFNFPVSGGQVRPLHLTRCAPFFLCQATSNPSHVSPRLADSPSMANPLGLWLWGGGPGMARPQSSFAWIKSSWKSIRHNASIDSIGIAHLFLRLNGAERGSLEIPGITAVALPFTFILLSFRREIIVLPKGTILIRGWPVINFCAAAAFSRT